MFRVHSIPIRAIPLKKYGDGSPKMKVFFSFKGGGGSGNNDHGFPFFRDVELVEPSLKVVLGVFPASVFTASV